MLNILAKWKNHLYFSKTLSIFPFSKCSSQTCTSLWLQMCKNLTVHSAQNQFWPIANSQSILPLWICWSCWHMCCYLVWYIFLDSIWHSLVDVIIIYTSVTDTVGVIKSYGILSKALSLWQKYSILSIVPWGRCMYELLVTNDRWMNTRMFVWKVILDYGTQLATG